MPLRDTEASFGTMREAFGVDSDEPWVLPFHAYLVRGARLTAIVDTGVGPLPREFLPDAEGHLPGRLAAAGVRPEEVELVVLTHLHVDHVGWNTLFGRARIVANRVDLEYFREARGDREYFRREVAALELDLVEGEAEIAPGLRLVPAYGHTPGHMRVEVGGGAAHLLGDVAVHELQLADPGLAYSAEVDASRAAALRAELLPRLADVGVPVALGHLSPDGLGRIRRAGDGFAWEPLR